MMNSVAGKCPVFNKIYIAVRYNGSEKTVSGMAEISPRMYASERLLTVFACVIKFVAFLRVMNRAVVTPFL